MKQCRNDFPIFTRQKDLIYLDSAASCQKPKQVIDALSKFYESDYAPIHRGIYQLAEKATEQYENARKSVAQFINAEPDEIIFTKNATEGINFVASTWAEQQLKAGDEIILTELEHHSNLIPWQQLAIKKGLRLRFITVAPDGSLNYDQLPALINDKTRLLAITHESNAIGTLVDVSRIINTIQKADVTLLIDAAQSAGHRIIDVKTLRCDFLVFSAHKMLGPTGIGALFIRKKIQHKVPPYQFGGGMLFEASYEKAVWRQPPLCYEAGTQPVVQAIGFAAAINYLKTIDFNELCKYEAALVARLIDGLQKITDVIILGPIEQLKNNGHLVSFVHKKFHSHDVAAYLDKYNVCVRSGHYCAQPLAKKLGIESSIRASFYLYNTTDDVDRLLQLLSDIK